MLTPSSRQYRQLFFLQIKIFKNEEPKDPLAKYNFQGTVQLKVAKTQLKKLRSTKCFNHKSSLKQCKTNSLTDSSFTIVSLH